MFVMYIQSLLEVGVEEAVRQAGFDRQTFEKRGGVYNWRKDDDEQIEAALQAAPYIE